MKKAFDGLISRLDTAEKELELENMSKNPKLKSKEKKRKSWNRISKNVGQLQRCNIHEMGIPEGERVSRREKIFETNIFLPTPHSGTQILVFILYCSNQQHILIDKSYNYFKCFPKSISKAESPSCYIYSKVSHVVWKDPFLKCKLKFVAILSRE